MTDKIILRWQTKQGIWTSRSLAHALDVPEDDLYDGHGRPQQWAQEEVNRRNGVFALRINEVYRQFQQVMKMTSEELQTCIHWGFYPPFSDFPAPLEVVVDIRVPEGAHQDVRRRLRELLDILHLLHQD